MSELDGQKRERLAAAGWRTGDATDFLGLSPEESAYVELKLALATHLRVVRTRRGLTQAGAAEIAGSSQSRVAKMETADASVSIDLMVRTLLALGVSRQQVGRVIARAA